MEKQPSIAIDAMSGDRGIDVSVPAALAILAKHDDIRLILVGQEQAIVAALNEHDSCLSDRLRCIHASEQITMDESPSHALRSKRDSSMRIAIEQVKTKTADACVSAGNTGALVAISRYVLRTLPGIDRPAITTTIPTATGHTHALDLGANIDCKAEQLVQFAVMGSALSMAVDNVEQPRIGLLNIGQESNKGNEVIKETDRQLQASTLNYRGYIEADQIYQGEVDVIITDGFTGNVALKAMEGTAKFIAAELKLAFNKNPVVRLAGWMAMSVMHAVQKRIDPRQYNGASILGLQGVVIKSHGSADQVAFQKALETAYIEARQQVPQLIDSQLGTLLK